MKVKIKLPEDLKIALSSSSFYIKDTPNGDILSVMCPPNVADMLKHNVFGIADKLTEVVKEQLGKDFKIDLAISDEVISTYKERIEQHKSQHEKGTVIPNTAQVDKQKTFETFEVSSCNETAFKTSFSYALDAHLHKLLFIYGDYGVGKSHLLNAIANKMIENGKTVAFFTSGDFSEYVLTYTHTKDFYKKQEKISQIKQSDVLMLDDFHLLKGRLIPQEELKMFIDYFFATGKPMVFTSLLNVNKLLTLKKMYKEELTSRFEEGLPLYIPRPDYQLKFALLKKFFAELNMYEDESIIKEFASIEVRNVRDLKNFVNSVHSIVSTYGKIPKDSIIERLVVEYGIRIPVIEEQKINEYIAQQGYEGITLSDLRNKSIRYKKELRKLRDKIIIHFITKEGYSYADLGRIFNLTRSAIGIIVKNHRNKSSQKE